MSLLIITEGLISHSRFVNLTLLSIRHVIISYKYAGCELEYLSGSPIQLKSDIFINQF